MRPTSHLCVATGDSPAPGHTTHRRRPAAGEPSRGVRALRSTRCSRRAHQTAPALSHLSIEEAWAWRSHAGQVDLHPSSEYQKEESSGRSGPWRFLRRRPHCRLPRHEVLPPGEEAASRALPVMEALLPIVETEYPLQPEYLAVSSACASPCPSREYLVRHLCRVAARKTVSCDGCAEGGRHLYPDQWLPNFNRRGFACSGVLIHPRAVLSARHCRDGVYVVFGNKVEVHDAPLAPIDLTLMILDQASTVTLLVVDVLDDGLLG